MTYYSYFITVYYRYRSGRTDPHYYCKVQGQSNGGFTDKEYTDRSGQVTLRSPYDKLNYIYVDGKSHSGPFYANNEYRFYVDE